MTLTDEEAREIIEAIKMMRKCDKCCGRGDFPMDRRTCHDCRGSGVDVRFAPITFRLIVLLESRLGVEDDLMTAYLFGFEKGKDAARKERRI